MLLAGVTACLVAFVTTPVVIAGMRAASDPDPVTERSSHLVPTHRGGGIAVVVAVLSTSGALVVTGQARPGLAAVIAVATFGAVGLAEDLAGVAVGPRFGLQVLAAGVAAGLALRGVDWLPALPTLAGVLIVIVGLTWVVAFVNAFNFMDGINGISAAQALVAGTTFAAVGQLHDRPGLQVGGLLAAASAVGFAPWNFPRAKIFLGDVGSYAFGGLLGVLALSAALDARAGEAALAPLVLYLADTSTTLTRRVLAGEPWHQPHRTHAYQRLTVAGWSHARVTCVFGLLALVTSGLGLLAARSAPLPRALCDAGILAVTVGYLALPTLVNEAQRRRRRVTRAAAAAPASVPAPRMASAERVAP